MPRSDTGVSDVDFTVFKLISNPDAVNLAILEEDRIVDVTESSEPPPLHNHNPHYENEQGAPTQPLTIETLTYPQGVPDSHPQSNDNCEANQQTRAPRSDVGLAVERSADISNPTTSYEGSVPFVPAPPPDREEGGRTSSFFTESPSKDDEEMKRSQKKEEEEKQEQLRNQEMDKKREENEILQKRTVLLDLQRIALQDGVTLTKEWTIEDRLEDMVLELRRHSLAQEEKTNVQMMKDGMKLMITGIEMVNTRYGILDLEGWSTDATRDINKHDANLSKIYRKYWRRGTSSSPEASIAMALVGSMGMHHLKKTMAKNIMGQNRRRPSPSASSYARGRRSGAYSVPDSSDEEEAPPH